MLGIFFVGSYINLTFIYSEIKQQRRVRVARQLNKRYIKCHRLGTRVGGTKVWGVFRRLPEQSQQKWQRKWNDLVRQKCNVESWLTLEFKFFLHSANKVAISRSSLSMIFLPQGGVVDTPLILSLSRQWQVELSRVEGQSALHREFQANWGYLGRPCLRN